MAMNMASERTLNILVVDDDDVDVMNIKRVFRQSQIHHPLFVASHGLEALSLLRSSTIPPSRRLVLLDINMPQMNGIEFLRELRSDPELKQTSVVILTTSENERDKRAASELNVAGYLIKPVTFDAFTEAMLTLNKYWTLMELPS